MIYKDSNPLPAHLQSNHTNLATVSQPAPSFGLQIVEFKRQEVVQQRVVDTNSGRDTNDKIEQDRIEGEHDDSKSDSRDNSIGIGGGGNNSIEASGSSGDLDNRDEMQEKHQEDGHISTSKEDNRDKHIGHSGARDSSNYGGGGNDVIQGLGLGDDGSGECRIDGDRGTMDEAAPQRTGRDGKAENNIIVKDKNHSNDK